MKSKVILGLVALVGTLFVSIPEAQANEFPTIESFTMTPNSIELTSGNTTVNFEIVVSHPYGVSDFARTLTAFDGVSSSYNTTFLKVGRPARFFFPHSTNT